MSEKEVNVKKSNNILVWILTVVVVCLIGYIVYTDFIMGDKEVKGETDIKNEVNEVSEQTKGLLRNILHITSNNEDTYSGSALAILMKYEGLVENFDLGEKRWNIYNYASRNGMLVKVTGNEYSRCEAGSGVCYGLTKDNYEKIARLYNINEDFDVLYTDSEYPDSYPKYNGMYLYSIGGFTITCHYQHNLTYSFDGNDIKVVDKYVYTDYQNNNAVENGTKTFTFKVSGSDYYLYSIS